MPGSSPRHQIQLPESPAKGNCQGAVTEFSSGECKSRKSQVKWLTADKGEGEGREGAAAAAPRQRDGRRNRYGKGKRNPGRSCKERTIGETVRGEFPSLPRVPHKR